MISKETVDRDLREAWRRDVPAAHTRASHVPYEVLVGLLGVPLLPLLTGLHLRQQRLPVRLVGLDDVLQLLHEEQLQHALIRVQVRQLEQLPLQDVVILEWSSGVDLQPVWDLSCVVRVRWHQHRLVSLRRTRLIGHRRRQRWRLIIARHARSTGVAILCPLVDVVHIVDPKLSRLHLFPARGEPFPLQRVAPVSSVGVVVDVVLPATDGPVDGPAGRKREVLSR